MRLLGLHGKLGFAAEAKLVEGRWSELVARTDPDCPPEFHRCYPDALVETCIRGPGGHARDRLLPRRSWIAGPGSGTLNDAWSEMWRKPTGYLVWERDAVRPFYESEEARPAQT